MALSLNDSYWIIPADQNYEWQKYNLYTNDFDKALELVAFSEDSHKVNGITISPEYTTNGMLKKCWHRENGQIYLYKGASRIYENGEMYSEYYCAQIAESMEFDALICNIDRHLGNFGMIIDNNTNEILRPAPIFDNGLSMMTTLESNEINENKEFLGFEKSAFDILFNQQLKYFVQPRHIPNLQKLKSFEFKKHKKFNLPDSWLEPIQKAIQNRANLALEFVYEKENKLQIAKI